jgi:DNA-binding transcriptional LysR family regulator
MVDGEERGQRVDVRSMEALLSVARHGSVSGAARAFGISQPSLTELLNRLEQRTGLKLLDRSTRGSLLTEEGSAVANWARTVLDASDELEVGIEALRRRRSGELRLSASMTIAEYLVPGWLARFRSISPETSVSLRIKNSQQAAADVLSGASDLGFLEGPTIPAGLKQRVVGTDNLAVLVSPDHPWARRRNPVTLDDLAHALLVVREPGSGTRETFVRAVNLAGGNINDHETLVLSSTAAIKAAVITGQGVGVLSALAVAGEIDRGVLVAVSIDGLDLRRRLRLVWPKRGELSDGADGFIRSVIAATSPAQSGPPRS